MYEKITQIKPRYTEEIIPRELDLERYIELKSKFRSLMNKLVADERNKDLLEKEIQYSIWLSENKEKQICLNIRGKDLKKNRGYSEVFPEYKDSIEVERIEEIELRKALEIGRYNWILDDLLKTEKNPLWSELSLQRVNPTDLERKTNLI